MIIKHILLIALFFSCIYQTISEQQYVYTIQYSKSYRHDLLSKYMGCNYSNIAYGTYTYPQGPKDALFVYMNQGTYQTSLNCGIKNFYIKLFGSQQNYDKLLQADPISTADRVKQSTSRLNSNYIVDWNCPLEKSAQRSRVWLNSFVQKLSGNAAVYIKAPASYLCYLINGHKYLLDLKANKFIIEMHGQEPGIYKTYDEIFIQEGEQQITNRDKYSKSCLKFPSYQTLVKNNPGKQFFIEKTLQKEQSGYIGPKFAEYLQKAKDIYGKIAFYDSFPDQIIQL